MARFTKSIIYSLFSVFLLSACSSSKVPNEFAKLGYMDGIYSTRSQAKDPVIAVLKLKNPALLETAQRKDGKLTIDAAQLKALQDEQTATIAELQKISSDIQVILRYRLVLNALTVVVPSSVLDQVKSLPNVTMSEKSSPFGRPRLAESEAGGIVGPKTSVNFIGADAAYAQNLHGEGMRVGVIDTGIDYTHKMFEGEGTEAAYKNNDPAKANSAFPNKKVVGGVDLVGTEYDSASPIFAKHIPTPDMNPLDEGGHGSHVAGTIAGLGDGVNTYSGVAPEASLYAIKVFGAEGSTNDEVVIAALEYAADPTGDLSFKEQLDVVNLSLGSPYGSPHLMYAHAVRNLVRAGTVVVTSAGNSGDKPFIVGSPSTSDEAISVAASIDNMNQNVQFNMAQFNFTDDVLKTEAVEATVSKALSTLPEMKGEVIAVGTAVNDFDPALKEQIKGKIALLDRGTVTFSEKIRKAQEAGAIAAIVANNADGDPFTMGGDGHYDIPAIMISKHAGDMIKEKLKTGVVQADLKPPGKIEKPELVDTITDFSSRGPRSEDGLIKPEISAPGANIISAQMGGGEKGVTMSGTSMAGPHITGVMALLKQKYKDLNVLELKSVLMGHAKVIANAQQKQYTVSRQGAGRVQIANSLDAKLVTMPAALSFGITDIEKQKTLSQDLAVKNISTETLTLKPEWVGSSALQFSVSTLTLAPGETKTLTVTVKVTAALMKNANDELDGFLKLSSDKEMVLQIPALVVARQISQISAKSLVVHATSAADAAGSVAEVQLQNLGVNKGTAYLFNLLGVDARKKDGKPDIAHNRNCDMQSAGYRVIEKEGARILQVAVKLYERMTTWNTCEVNVQIDSNNDNKADQEVAGVPMETLQGLTGDSFASLLLDGNIARRLRKEFEVKVATDKDHIVKENYSPALLDVRDMQTFDSSTLAIIEANVTQLAVADSGELNIKISTSQGAESGGVVEMDDFLGDANQWMKISLNPLAQAHSQLPEVVELNGASNTTLRLQKGYGSGDLILYAPQNKSVQDVLLEDAQSQVVPVSFGE
jgi:subtilisin family serine protease